MFDIVYSKAVNPIAALTKLIGKKKTRELLKAKAIEALGKNGGVDKMKDDAILKVIVSTYDANTIRKWIIDILNTTPVGETSIISKFVNFLEAEVNRATKELSQKFVIVKGKNDASTQVLGVVVATGKTVSIGGTFTKRPDETEKEFIKRAKDITIEMLREELSKN